MQAFESRQLRVTCFGAKLFSSHLVKKFHYAHNNVCSYGFCLPLQFTLKRLVTVDMKSFISVLTNQTEGLNPNEYNKSVFEDK